MRFSLSKINQLLATNLTLEKASNAFNQLGFEVEETYHLSSIVSDKLVVGKIISITKHPNASRLNICQVKINQDQIQQIICGAPNVKLDANVIVALPGAKLPKLTIKISEIRGVESAGMLCSLSEIGISSANLGAEQQDGIFLFECADKFLGNSALAHLELDAAFIELAILADRSDMHCLFNVGLELGASLNKPLLLPTFKKVPLAAFKNPTTIKIKTPDYYAYSNVIIDNYQALPSPWWLVKYLIGINIKSVDLITDLANYVNNLTGNPIDILDAHKVNNFDLEIINDPKNYQLDLSNQLLAHQFSNKVVLKNHSDILAIGASINNLAFMHDAKSTKLLISSSSYSNLIARQYIKSFNNLNNNLNQHAKGTNAATIADSLSLFINLLSQISPTITISNIVGIKPKIAKPKTFKISIAKLNSFLGYSQDWTDAITHLERLGFNIKLTNNNLSISAPQYRQDIELDVNLIAEFIRMLNYDTIKVLAPIGNEENTYPDARYLWEQQLMRLLSGQNIYNTKTYSLVSETNLADFDIFNYQNPIRIKDPLSSSHQVMRLSLIRSLLNILEYNANNYAKDVNLFEISNVYYGDRQATRHLSLVINGDLVKSSLFNDLSLSNNFYTAKGLVNAIIATQGIEQVSYQPLTNHPHFHPGTSAVILINQQVIGYLGKPHPNFYNKFSPIIISLDLDALFELRKPIYIAAVSKLAQIERDISFVVHADLLAGELINLIKATPDVAIADVTIFDFYQDETLKNQHQKVLSVKYWITQTTTTYNKKDLEIILHKIVDYVTNNIPAQIRE